MYCSMNMIGFVQSTRMNTKFYSLGLAIVLFNSIVNVNSMSSNDNYDSDTPNYYQIGQHNDKHIDPVIFNDENGDDEYYEKYVWNQPYDSEVYAYHERTLEKLNYLRNQAKEGSEINEQINALIQQLSFMIHKLTDDTISCNEHNKWENFEVKMDEYWKTIANVYDALEIQLTDEQKLILEQCKRYSFGLWADVQRNGWNSTTRYADNEIFEDN